MPSFSEELPSRCWGHQFMQWGARLSGKEIMQEPELHRTLCAFGERDPIRGLVGKTWRKRHRGEKKLWGTSGARLWAFWRDGQAKSCIVAVGTWHRVTNRPSGSLGAPRPAYVPPEPKEKGPCFQVSPAPLRAPLSGIPLAAFFPAPGGPGATQFLNQTCKPLCGRGMDLDTHLPDSGLNPSMVTPTPSFPLSNPNSHLS